MRAGQKRNAARALRRNATDAERTMWSLLRNRQLNGAKFRRQVPIGPFVVDFASIEHRLVVEWTVVNMGSPGVALRGSFARSSG